ncbi:MAG: TetR/AcrR family transcriptional regulator [Gemmatimonadaceae bacterium]
MAQHRARILDVASRAFRARGFEGSTVADIMKDAGLTHGGFYGHFESKAHLEAAACATAIAPAAARWAAVIEDSGDSPEDARESIVDGYLSERHRDSPATGCVFAALGPEASRGDPAVRKAFTDGLKTRLDLLAQVVTGQSRKVRRDKAIATMAGLVGAIVLSRAVNDPDLSDEILEAVRSEYG